MRSEIGSARTMAATARLDRPGRPRPQERRALLAVVRRPDRSGTTPALAEPTAAAFGSGLLAVVSWLRAACLRLARGSAARRDAERVRGLPDHLLRDLGLSRCEIGHAAHSGGLPRRGPFSDRA